MTQERVVQKTIKDVERVAKCTRDCGVARQTAIEILIELKAGCSFSDPYVEHLFSKMENAVLCLQVNHEEE